MVSFIAWTALLLSLLLSLADYLSEGLFVHISHESKEKVISLAGGISTSYLFLSLLPKVYSGVEEISSLIFVFVLLGFVTYHVAQKYIYQHTKGGKLRQEKEIEHSIALYFYHFVIGILFVTLARDNVATALLFFFAVFLHVIIDALPHKTRYTGIGSRTFFAIAPLVGSLFAILIPFPVDVEFALLGIITGLLIFIEIREVIPSRRHGRIPYYLGGVFSYGGIIVLTWLL